MTCSRRPNLTHEGERSADRSGDRNASFFKFTTSFLAGVVLTMILSYVTANRDLVTKTDLAAAMAQQQRQIDDHQKTLGEINQSLIQLHTDMGSVSATLAMKGNH